MPAAALRLQRAGVMRADLAPRAVAPVPAVDPPSAVDPRAAKPPMTKATSTTRVKRADLAPKRRLTVTTAPSLRGFPGFPAWRGRSGYSIRHTNHKGLQRQWRWRAPGWSSGRRALP